jgi:hypothetical protein
VYRNGKQVGTSTTTSFTDNGVGRPDATLVNDGFSRMLKTWGAAPAGGAYGYSNDGAGFSTNGANGVMQLDASNRSLQAGLPQTTSLSVDMRATFTIDKRPAGGTAAIMMIARARGVSDTANSYRSVVAISPAGTITYGVRKLINGRITALGPTPVAPFTFAANQLYTMRFQVTGASPTIVRLKLWRDGTVEPALWTVVASNGGNRLQGAGLIAVRSVIGRRVSNRPLAALIDSFNVLDMSPSNEHAYTVRAEDTSGNLSAPSAPFTVTVR